MAMRQIEIGTRFGRLVTTGPVFSKLRGKTRPKPRSFVPVRCDCGNEREVSSHNLLDGNTQSCGCYRRDQTVAARTTHGMSGEPLYQVWASMRGRCLTPSSSAYRWYGGRGIGIDPTWDDFAVFKAWAESTGYSPGLELDREDADKDYGPGNCRWLTKRSNIEHMRRSWGPETDAALLAYAKQNSMTPFEVIELAVLDFLAGSAD